jgi:hypothetical protein
MSRARIGTELFVALECDERSGHDPLATEPVDALGDTRRRLGASRAKQLAINELDPDSTDTPCNGDGGSRRSAVTPLAARHPQVSASYRGLRTRGVGDAAMGAQLNVDRDLVRSKTARASSARSVIEPRATLERLRLAAELAARLPACERAARGRDRGRGR